jgi:phospholipid/cholesterol/gamma-HCH transport system substrate-binding protein
MKLTRKDELKVGILSLILIAGIMILFFAFGSLDVGGGGGSEYVLNFRFLDGLREGASVRFSGGIVCGTVRSIQANDQFAAVRIWVNETIEVTDITIFTISTAGLIGEKYVNIKKPEDGGEVLADGTVVDRTNIQDPMNMDEALLKVNDIVADINVLSNSLSSFIAEEGGPEDLGKAVGNISNLIGTIDELLTGNKEVLNTSVKQLTYIMSNVNSITEKADNIMGTATELTQSLQGEEVVDLLRNVNVMVVSITDIVEDVGLVVADTRNSLSTFLVRVDDFVETTEIIISDIGPEVGTVLSNVDTTFQSVGDDIKDLVVSASSAIGSLQGEISVALSSLNQTAVSLSGRVGTTLDEFDFQVEGLVTDLRRTVRTVDSSITGVSKELIALTESSSVKIDETLTYIRDLTANIKASADVFSPEELEQILDSIKALTEEMENIATTSGDKIDEIFEKVDSIANDVSEIVADAKEGLSPTLEAIRSLSVTLESLSKMGEEKLSKLFDQLDKLSENLAFLTEDGKNRIKDMFDNIDSLIQNLDEISENIQPGMEKFFAESGSLNEIVNSVNEIIITIQDVIVNLGTDMSVTLENIDEATYDVSAFFEAAQQVEEVITLINTTIEEIAATEGDGSFNLSEVMNMLVQIRDIVETLRYIIDQLAPLLDDDGED